jgi:hypothetical protein
MKRWILVTSGKGGVGKSLVARLLAEAKRESDPSTWLLDGDGEVGQLVQYLGTRDQHGKLVRGQVGDVGVGTLALHAWRDDAGMRDVLDGLIAPLRTARTDVLVDLPAASLAVLATLERNAGLATGAARLGFRPTLVVPISPLVASRLSIAEALDLGPGYDVVAVRSEFWGNDGDYRRWLSSKLRAQLLDRGGREVVIPRLRGWIIVDLDERHLPFAAATRPGVLDYPDDEMLTRWLAQSRLALSAAGDLLGLPVGAPA